MDLKEGKHNFIQNLFKVDKEKVTIALDPVLKHETKYQKIIIRNLTTD